MTVLSSLDVLSLLNIYIKTIKSPYNSSPISLVVPDRQGTSSPNLIRLKGISHPHPIDDTNTCPTSPWWHLETIASGKMSILKKKKKKKGIDFLF